MTTLQTLFSDTFDYADGPLSAQDDWQIHNTGAITDQFSVSSNAVILPATAARRSAQLIGEFAGDQWASVDVIHTSTIAVIDFGIGLCFSSPGATENHYRFLVKSMGGVSNQVNFTISRLLNGVSSDRVIGAYMQRPDSPFTIRARKVGANLYLDLNGAEILTVSDTSFTGGSVGITGFAGGSAQGWRLDNFQAGNIVASGPSINQTGTDTTLTVGATHSIAFAGITSNPASVAIVRDDVVAEQADFVLGEVDEDGNATGSFAATIGDLPYTDASYPAASYSYRVTCANGSTITLANISIAPAEDREFVTAVDPVNDATSIIPVWVEGGAVTGSQVDWPSVVGNIAPTVNPDFTHSGERIDPEIPWPESITFTVNFWDTVDIVRFAVEIEVAYSEGGTGTVIGITTRELTTRSLTVRNLTMRSL